MFKPVYFYFCVFYSSEEMNFLRADWSFLFFLSYWKFYYRGKGNFGTLFIKTLFYTFFSFNLLIWSWTFILFVGFSSSVSTIICYLIPFLFSFSFRIWTYYTSLFTSLYCPDLSFLCYFLLSLFISFREITFLTGASKVISSDIYFFKGNFISFFCFLKSSWLRGDSFVLF